MKSMTRPAKWIAICCVILGVSVVVVASRVSPPRRGAIALNLEDPGVPREIGGGLDAMMEGSAGWFIMGSDGGRDNEKPRRRVYLDAFYIDKYPVTNSRFRKFGKPKKDYGAKFNGPRQPVVGVDWFQARDYCKSAGRRLPTEAEWEKAARGVDGRKYPWGNEWEKSRVIREKNSGRRTHPVDRTANTHRSPYGVVDMVGNVWEWLSDWYGEDYFRNAPNRNPKGPPSGKSRMLRGAGWYFNKAAEFRIAFRGRHNPDSWNENRSFRCAKDPEG